MLLEVKDLHAGIDGKEILKGLNLQINKGEVHAIMGRTVRANRPCQRFWRDIRRMR